MADQATPAQATPQAGDAATLVTQTPAPTPQGQTLMGKESESATPPAPAPPTPEAEKPAVPEKYELKLKENSGLNEEYVEKLQSFARERGLTNEQAQSVLDREIETQEYLRTQSRESQRLQSEKWVGDVKADAEIGGLQFDKSVALATKLVNRFGTTELKKALNESGFGNHPELIRFVTKIAKTMSDDQLVMPSAVADSGAQKSYAEVLYGKK